MATLRAKGEYHAPARNLHYQAGQEFEADDALFLFLMADAPDNFEAVALPQAATFEAPPADKMLRSPKGKK